MQTSQTIASIIHFVNVRLFGVHIWLHHWLGYKLNLKQFNIFKHTGANTYSFSLSRRISFYVWIIRVKKSKQKKKQQQQQKTDAITGYFVLIYGHAALRKKRQRKLITWNAGKLVARPLGINCRF